MSPHFPIVKASACLKALEKAGFRVDHQKGSHARLINIHNPKLRVTIPIHNKDLPQGTLRSILRQAGLNIEEFIRLLE
jgi:predicted RNA binding protein YcfA (HicA-like mRNA interferase family)